MSEASTTIGTDSQNFSPGPRFRVALADDDPDMRRLLYDALGREGYDVVEFADGLHLTAHVGASVPGEIDLIISDIRMPGVSGLDLLEGLCDTQQAPPIILITAFGDDETHAKAKSCGVAAILDKPFAVECLMDTVRQILQHPVRRAAP